MAQHDVMLEIHEEQVTEMARSLVPPTSVDQRSDTGFHGVARLKIDLARIWFVQDRNERVWWERRPDGSSYEPGDHIVIDLDLSGSKLVVESIDAPATKLDGTVTVAAGSSAVTGTATRFAGQGLGVGEWDLYAVDPADPAKLTLVGTVAAVASNTTLTLRANAAVALANARCVALRRLPVEAQRAVDGQLFARTNSKSVTGVNTRFVQQSLRAGAFDLFRASPRAFIGAIDSVVSDTSLTLRDNAALDLSSDTCVAVPVLEVGPPGGQKRRTPINEVPLAGRVGIHDHFDVRSDSGGRANVVLDLGPVGGGSPPLAPDPPPAMRSSVLFGRDITGDRTPGGRVLIGGSDPRIVLDMSVADAYYASHSFLGFLATIADQTANPGLTAAEAENRFLDQIASALADGIKARLAQTVSGPQQLLPGGGIMVEPNSTDAGAIRELKVRGLYWPRAGQRPAGGSLAILLRTADPPIPDAEALPSSTLASHPKERVALTSSGWALLRSVRQSMIDQYCLSADDFDADAGCLLSNDVATMAEDGTSFHFTRFEATIEDELPPTADAARVPGRVLIRGAIRKETFYYGLAADLEMGLGLEIDDVPRSPLEDPRAVEMIQRRMRELQAEYCTVRNDAEARKAKVAEKLDERQKLRSLPRSVGIAPVARPERPKIDSEFWFTPAGYVITAVVLIGLILGGGALAGVGAASPVAAIALLTTALVTGITGPALFDAFVATPAVQQKLSMLGGEPPDGSALPTGSFVPVDVALDRDLTAFLSSLPQRAQVTCAKKDTKADVDRIIQSIGGIVPGDGRTWKVSVYDAISLMKADGGRQAFFIRDGSGQESELIVATSSAGREYLRSKPEADAPVNLSRLPSCPRTPAP